ncbi:MAG: 2-oxoacid:acceptor oxidoreductase family protein [Deltaproteobacteria bacterium]|nr:2-oxoacid:acceptor oxidoreductase family protein [Deltaproteobacteria bacterium]MBW2070357.1 2-oxoacid:acceptor oxidoreductase family protein [Deltaproteobacteria bacterium]
MTTAQGKQKVYTVTWHGRGGQGGVTAAMILAEAAYLDGYQGVAAAPFFGVERRGAPITASTRIARERLRTVIQEKEADVVLVLDERLIRTANVLAGLKKEGLLIVNSAHPPEAVCQQGGIVVATSDASGVARKIGLTVAGTVLVNTAMLGAFCRATGLVSMESLTEAIKQNFNDRAARLNIEGARLTFAQTQIDGSWQP